MESAPGTAEQPSWADILNWKSSGPFYIKWLQICETRFSRVGHLKNAYNDFSPVLVGRDGQEVEEDCGAGLCELIDQEAETSAGWM
jgi:YTH domain-containing protein 1